MSFLLAFAELSCGCIRFRLIKIWEGVKNGKLKPLNHILEFKSIKKPLCFHFKLKINYHSHKKYAYNQINITHVEYFTILKDLFEKPHISFLLIKTWDSTDLFWYSYIKLYNNVDWGRRRFVFVTLQENPSFNHYRFQTGWEINLNLILFPRFLEKHPTPILNKERGESMHENFQLSLCN